MKQTLATGPHPLFLAQVPLLLTYMPFLEMKRFPTKIHEVIYMGHIQEAMKRSAEKGTLYFSELHRLRKAEKEQAALDYHLLGMEVKNPSERYTGGSSKTIAEQAKTLYDGLRAFDSKQSISLKTLLNQGIYAGTTNEVSLFMLSGHLLTE